MILKRFYGLIFRHAKLFTFSTFLVILTSILSNIAPFMLRDMVNAVEDQKFDAAISVFVIILSVKVAEILISNISRYVIDVIIIRVLAETRNMIFGHLHDLDFHYHTNKSSGKLISTLKRGENAGFQYYDELNVNLLTTLIDFVFLLVVFSQLYPKLLYFSIGIFALNAFIMYFTVRYNISEREKYKVAEDALTILTVDNMVAFDTVKYFSGEHKEQKKHVRLMDRFAKAFIHYGLSFRVMDIANGGLLSLGAVGMVGIALFDLINGNIRIGDFILVTAFSTSFSTKMNQVVYRLRNLLKLQGDLEDYISILDEEVVVKDTVDAAMEKQWTQSVVKGQQGVSITFKNISFTYEKTHKNALSGVNLEIKPNESVAFVGISGVGKTTLTKLLMRFYDPTEGEILVNDMPITSIAKSSLRRAIGIVPQETVLFNNTIGYNIAYGDQEKGSGDLEKALKMAHLDGFVKSLPQGLDTIVGERGIKLSGGQKQRLAIARAFMKDAPIIILDEATSNLDSESERLIQDAFWKLAKNKTTIIIAHRLSTIQKVDRIIVFEKGRIVDQGTHDELRKKDSGLYRYLWELQSKGNLN